VVAPPLQTPPFLYFFLSKLFLLLIPFLNSQISNNTHENLDLRKETKTTFGFDFELLAFGCASDGLMLMLLVLDLDGRFGYWLCWFMMLSCWFVWLCRFMVNFWFLASVVLQVYVVQFFVPLLPVSHPF